MNILTIDELKSLVEASTGPFVTIALPTQRAGADTRQNVIRFKKLLRDAEDQLGAGGMRPAEAQQLLEPARALLEDSPLWQHQKEGLAVFISPGMFRRYQMSIKPEAQGMVVVGERFQIKPILHLLTGNRRFFILALSQNKMRLLEATSGGAHEVELKDVPHSLDEATNMEPQDRQLQFRTLTNNRPGKGDAVFYGLGSPADLSRERILRYCQMVDAGVSKYLQTSNHAPLVFAGVDYLFPIYKEVNTVAQLMETPIAGNPDDMSPDELQRRAWGIVQPEFENARLEATEHYRQIANTARASHKIGQVAPAAVQGRVDVLFIQKDAQAWGSYAPEVGAVHEYDAPQPGSVDMLDFAAAHTLMNGGTVYALDPPLMPNGSSVAAIFRY